MNLNGLSVREKVYRCMIMAIPYMKKGERSYQSYMEKYPIGGLYFSKGPARDLVEEHEGAATTTSDVVTAFRRAAPYPLLVCADGANIGDNGLPPVRMEALGAAHSTELAYDCGRALGMQMNANDVDWLLGPAVDMPLVHLSDSISTMMSNDPVYSADIFSEVVRGIQSQNVAATVKHFPGLGTHYVNMHFAPGTNTLPFDEWMETYGYLYKRLFKAGAMSLMTSHVMLPSYTKRADFGKYPIATFSKDITIGLLKEKLGFEGAVVTDALTMGGCMLQDETEQAVAAFACGADLLLWPTEEAGDRIVEEIEKGNIPMSRLDDAVARVSAMREKLQATDAPRPKKPVDPIFVDGVFDKITREEITLVRNDVGTLPLPSTPLNIRVITVGEPPKAADDTKETGVEAFCETLRAAGHHVTLEAEKLALSRTGVALLEEHYDRVIYWFAAHPIAKSYYGFCAWSSHKLTAGKRVVINFQTPFLIPDYFAETDTFVQVHSDRTPYNMKLLAEAIMGKIPMPGKLCVDITK